MGRMNFAGYLAVHRTAAYYGEFGFIVVGVMETARNKWIMWRHIFESEHSRHKWNSIRTSHQTLFMFFINRRTAADGKLVEFWMKPDKRQ